MAKTSDLSQTREFSSIDRAAGREAGSAGTAPVREATDDARQAEAPHTLRYMLAIGLVGVIVAFAIIYFIFI